MLANYKNFQPNVFLESKYSHFDQDEINAILLNEGISDFKIPTVPNNFNFKKVYTDLNNNAYEYLSKFKITKADINKLVLQVKSEFTSAKDPSKTAKKIIDISSKFVRSKVTINESVTETFRKKSTTQKVVLSLILTVILLLINSILITLFPSVMGYIACAALVAPIIEEYAKRIAVKDHMPWLYVSIFSGTEFVLWVVQLIIAGFEPITAIILRIQPVAMHFFTTFIQKKFEDRSKQKQDEHYSRMGYFLAVLFHILYNFMNIIPLL